MQEILFSKPMMFPCVNTTSMYSLYNFSRARMMRSNVRNSWFIGFSRAYKSAFLLACNCYTCPLSAVIQASRSLHTAKTDRCSARTCFNSARVDSSQRPLPQFLESSASRNQLRWVAAESEAASSLFCASRCCTLSERAAIQMLSFLMNSVFSQRYLRIYVLERSYLSMIFLDFSYFSLSQSAIFYKLSLSSSSFFLRFYTSFSFCCTLVRSTASFFSHQTSWLRRDQTYGFVLLDSILRISSSTFFSSVKLVTSWVFSASSFSRRRLFSCSDLVQRESSSVCWRKVVKIYLQLSSLARRALTSPSDFFNCYSSLRICSWASRDSPPPIAFARSFISSLVCWTFPSLACTSLMSAFISQRSSPKVNYSSYSSAAPLASAYCLRASCSLTNYATAYLLSAAMSASSWMLAATSVSSLRQSSISLGARKEMSMERLRTAYSSSVFLLMAYLIRVNIQFLQLIQRQQLLHIRIACLSAVKIAQRCYF